MTSRSARRSQPRPVAGPRGDGGVHIGRQRSGIAPVRRSLVARRAAPVRLGGCPAAGRHGAVQDRAGPAPI